MGYVNLWSVKKSRLKYKKVCSCTSDGKLIYYNYDSIYKSNKGRSI